MVCNFCFGNVFVFNFALFYYYILTLSSSSTSVLLHTYESLILSVFALELFTMLVFFRIAPSLALNTQCLMLLLKCLA